MNDAMVADETFVVHGDIGINSTEGADFDMIAQHHPCFNPAALSYFGMGANHTVGCDAGCWCHIGCGVNHSAGMHPGLWLEFTAGYPPLLNFCVIQIRVADQPGQQTARVSSIGLQILLKLNELRFANQHYARR